MYAFTILGHVNRDDEYGIPFTTVRIGMPVKAWAKAKRQGALGTLYGVDISNAVHRIHGLNAYNPTADDSRRAVNGMKLITLTYYNAKVKATPKLRLVVGSKR